MMNKRELFDKALKSGSEFRDYEINNLSMVGDFFGRHPMIFKKIYRSFSSKEDSVTFEPEVGAVVNIIYSRDSDEVTVSRLDLEISFSYGRFLRFIELVELCYAEVFPIGSIVELDLELVPGRIKNSVDSNDKSLYVMIVAQKVPLENNEHLYADYAVTLWPFGLQKYTPPFFIANMMIKNMIHKGMRNETEKAYLDKIKEKIIVHEMNSFMYLRKDDLQASVNSTVNLKKKGEFDE